MTASAAVHRPRSGAYAALSGLLLSIALVPAPAHAQFGRLRDLGKAAARGAVEKTVEKQVEQQATAAIDPADGAGPAAAGAPRYSESVLEITDARVERLLRGLDAERAARPAAERRYQAQVAAAGANDRTYSTRLAAYERERAEWARRDSARAACVDAAQRGNAGAVEAEERRGEAVRAQVDAELTDERQARVQAMQKRLQAAQARGDQRAVRALADSMQADLSGAMRAVSAASGSAARMNEMSRTTMAAATACGTVPPEPRAPSLAGWVNPGAASDTVRAIGIAASGLTVRQYEVLRERVETYVRLAGRTGATRYVFSAGELDVLGRRLPGLQARPELLELTEWRPQAPRS